MSSANRSWAARIALLAASVSAVACLPEQQVRRLVVVPREQRAPIAIVDVRVFPATAPDLVLEHQDVLVEGDRIVAVRDTGAPLPPNAARIAGPGRTVLPGLVDAHAHTQITGAPPWHVVQANPAHVLEEALYAGITTMHDLGGRLADGLALKRAVEAGELPGPRLLVAGPFFVAPGGYPESYIARVLPAWLVAFALDPFLRKVRTIDDARRYVDECAEAGVDFIKIAVASTPDSGAVLSPPLVRAVVQAAHARGLPVLAHVDTAAHALVAVDNGVDVLAHGIHSSALSHDEAKAIGMRSVTVVPTLVTFERLYQLRYATVQLSALERETVAADIQRSLLRRPDGYRLDAELLAWLDHLEEHRAARLGPNVARLREAGTRIAVGTDGHGSTASFPAAIHEEMRRLVEAGIPPAEVLLGATLWSAQLVDPTPSFGTVEVGKDADLLLVEGNPLEDIGATANIVEVIARGRRVQRIRP
ncbi:MAG: amidohydrolase family protein [Deltaproteobacteria bacterium]|nr:amidohydrolase family protein [Deltaproteobacteria bacterium]